MVDSEIREYQEADEAALVALTEELQDYLAAIDPLKRLMRGERYGPWYAAQVLRRVHDNSGRILVAEIAGRIVAYIAGVIDKESPDMGIGYVPTKAGRITELVVAKSVRSAGIGAQLMAELETFFRESGCDVIRVEVFAPNEGAHRFYSRRGYLPRTFDLLKVLSRTDSAQTA